MIKQVTVARYLLLLLSISLCISGCGLMLTEPPDVEESLGQVPDLPDSSLEHRILIDASRDGGVWWFPQAGPFFPEEDHQGRALAEYLRGLGYEVEELPRGVQITDSLLVNYKYVIRAAEWGSYRGSELAAYGRFVERETTLILLSDHRKTDPSDELAEMLGVTFTGFLGGSVNRFATHAITNDVWGGLYYDGAVATSFNTNDVEVIAWVDYNQPVMGVINSHVAKIFFSGDTNIFQSVPQPLVDNLVSWGFDGQ